MPVFYQRTDGSGFYAKANIQGSIVTFQLTARGVHAASPSALRTTSAFSKLIQTSLVEAA